MSVLIKGMEMPKDGTFNIVHIYSDGRVSIPYWGKGMQVVQDFKAFPVPPHGRLVDADALVQLFKETAAEHGGLGGIMVALAAACVDAAPTIIPAEPLEEQA